MDLVKFDENYMLKPYGLVNIGSICYLNSFIQALMSCTSATVFLLENEDRFRHEKNLTAMSYIDLIKSVQNADTGVVINPKPVFDAIIAATRKRDPTKIFGAGQEDSGEGLALFLNAIDDDGLYALFMYTYVVKRICLNCNNIISESIDKSCFLEVPQSYSGIIINEKQKTMDPLNLHIMQNMSILQDYKCPQCKEKGNRFCTIYQLSKIPEIIVVTFNKFFKKNISHYPDILLFTSTNGNDLEYKLVSTIEHMGGGGGGHYWANGIRESKTQGDIKSDTWDSEPLVKSDVFKFNDRVVSQGSFSPTQNTYILFYHIK